MSLGFDHAQLDLSNLEGLREKVGVTTFDVLINAAAFTNVDACETERDRAFRINAEAPGILAEICNEKDAKLIHLGTDYVFNGENVLLTRKKIQRIRSALTANQSLREKRTCLRLTMGILLCGCPGCLALTGQVSSTP